MPKTTTHPLPSPRAITFSLSLLASAVLLAGCASAPAQFAYTVPAQPEGSSGYTEKPGWATEKFAVAAANPPAPDNATLDALVAAMGGRPLGQMPEGVSGISIDSRSLKPGEAFEYTSGCPIATPVGSMRGSYQCVAADGTRFVTDNFYIPFAGFYPEHWFVERLPLRRALPRMLARHQKAHLLPIQARGHVHADHPPLGVQRRTTTHARVQGTAEEDVGDVAALHQAVVGALHHRESHIVRIAHRVDAIALGQRQIARPEAQRRKASTCSGNSNQRK